jgi:hypothetical protein
MYNAIEDALDCQFQRGYVLFMINHGWAQCRQGSAAELLSRSARKTILSRWRQAPESFDLVPPGGRLHSHRLK